MNAQTMRSPAAWWSLPSAIRNERRLSDNDINEWFDVPKFIVPFSPSPYTKTQLQQQLLSQPLVNRGGPLVMMRTTKPGSSRKTWWGFESEYYDIAIKTNGTVAVKGWQHRRLTLWIRPDGEAGTSEEKDLDLNQLANDEFAKALQEITALIGEWAGRVKGRKIPEGPSLLLKKSMDAVSRRKNGYNEADEEAKTGFFFHIMPWEWPF